MKSILIYDYDDERLDAVYDQFGLNASEVIEGLLDDYLDEYLRVNYGKSLDEGLDMKYKPMREAKIVRVTELSPQNDSRKSFYGKAKVLTYDDGSHELQSYGTIVSREKNGEVQHLGKYSQTTSRHQKEFEKQFGRKNESLNESMSASKLAKEINDAVKWLVKEDEGCSTIKLDDRLAVCVGWSDGYDPDDDSVIHSNSEPTWVINAGIKVWTSDDMRTDFDWINSPYDDEIVFDNDVALDPNDPGNEADWLLKAYEELKKYLDYNHLEIEKDGKIVPAEEEEDDWFDESLKNKKLNESAGTYDYREAVLDDVIGAIDGGDYDSSSEFANRDEYAEYLYNVMWADDGITGNGSSSYTFSRAKAAKYLEGNYDLLVQALKDFGFDTDDEDLIARYYEEEPEQGDVTIRCYLLGGCIDRALDLLKGELKYRG